MMAGCGVAEDPRSDPLLPTLVAHGCNDAEAPCSIEPPSATLRKFSFSDSSLPKVPTYVSRKGSQLRHHQSKRSLSPSNSRIPSPENDFSPNVKTTKNPPNGRSEKTRPLPKHPTSTSSWDLKDIPWENSNDLAPREREKLHQRKISEDEDIFSVCFLKELLVIATLLSVGFIVSSMFFVGSLPNRSSKEFDKVEDKKVSGSKSVAESKEHEEENKMNSFIPKRTRKEEEWNNKFGMGSLDSRGVNQPNLKEEQERDDDDEYYYYKEKMEKKLKKKRKRE
jgi:hypothetical protein